MADTVPTQEWQHGQWFLRSRPMCFDVACSPASASGASPYRLGERVRAVAARRLGMDLGLDDYSR